MKLVFDYLKAFMLFCAVAVTSGVIVMKVSMYMGGESAPTPDVHGKNLVQAMETLDLSGFNLKITRLEYDPVTPRDRIISQKPVPGEPLKVGRDVKVIISRGPEQTRAPSLAGMTQRSAEAELGKTGLKIRDRIYVHSGQWARGLVVAQAPAPGTRLQTGALVTLLVSAGPFAKYLMAPDMMNKPLPDVMEKLRTIDLKISHVTYKPDSSRQRGVVISQAPGFGERVARGSFVSLVVSEGKPLDSDTPATFTFLYYTVPDGPSAVKLSIIQENVDGEKEVYNRVRRPGDAVSLLVELKGPTAAKIFINDELAEVKRFQEPKRR